MGAVRQCDKRDCLEARSAERGCFLKVCTGREENDPRYGTAVKGGNSNSVSMVSLVTRVMDHVVVVVNTVATSLAAQSFQ
jgi:hypothetical protein